MSQRHLAEPFERQWPSRPGLRTQDRNCGSGFRVWGLGVEGFRGLYRGLGV